MKLSHLVSICLIGIVEAKWLRKKEVVVTDPPCSAINQESSFIQASANRTSDPPTQPPPGDRQLACRMCFRKCPINCFVGTCGQGEDAFTSSTTRFKFTDKCWTCDPQASVGINKEGDFEVCSPKDASAPAPYIKKVQATGPTGPGLPCNPGPSAEAAEAAAKKAADEAQKAADEVDKIEKAVEEKREKEAALAKQGEALKEKAAEAQLDAENALKKAEAATDARNIAEQHYNKELKKLRKQQLLSGRAEEILLRATKASKDANETQAKQEEAAGNAADAASMLGAEGAKRAQQEADAEEMAAAARSAQRAAMDAAKGAKQASDKLGKANAIAQTPDHPPATPPPTVEPPAAALMLNANPNENEGADATDSAIEKMAGLPAGAMSAQDQVPEFLGQMMDNGGVDVSQTQPTEAEPQGQEQFFFNDKSQPQTAPQQVPQGGDVGSATVPFAQSESEQDGFLPGMLSTIQVGSRKFSSVGAH